MPLIRTTLIVLIVSFVGACAQVPKESVELSTTVGRDVTTSYKSQRELAKILFARIRQDVNRFVDNVYAPYQIRTAMESDFKNSKSSDAKDRRASILLAINEAFKPGASDKLQRQVVEAMGDMVSIIREDIESKRQELLDPINRQEATVLSAIDRNYAQIIYANAIVTGHLASIAKVQDAQNEVLKAIGVDADLSKLIGENLATASDTVGKLVNKAESAQATAQNITTTIKEIKSAISGK